MQRFFTRHCPKLYELQAVAYWALEKEAHPSSFLANLTHITQVVIQLRNTEEGFFEMKFQKAEDRRGCRTRSGRCRTRLRPRTVST